MSHNQRCYVKKITKSVAHGSKRVDLMFKQAALSTTANTRSNTVNSEECGDQPKHNQSSSSAATAATSTSETILTNPEPEPSSSGSEDGSEDEVPVPDARLFSSGKYEKRFSWLYFSVAKGGYCCKLCEIFCPFLQTMQVNPYVSGVLLGTHPSRKLKKHDGSKIHLDACKKQATLLSDSTQKTQILDMLQRGAEKQNTAELTRNRHYITALIKTVYFVIRQRWAVDSISDIMDHTESLGTTDIVNYIQVHPDLKYTSSTSVSDIISAINCCLESEMLGKVRNADAYALLADESSDESHREQFAILAKFKVDSTVGDYYLGIIEVQRTDAASLMAAIERFLIAKGVNISKAAFVGFDGCNTMSGENKGLQRRFRHVVPHQIYINCRNHKLALCVKHLIKRFPVIDVVDGLLIGIWKLFHYSPKKYATFKAVQESYGLTHLRLIKACTTRWLSHGRACVRLVDRFIQIVDTLDACLDEKYEPEVHGIREQLLNKNTVSTVVILCDILQPVIRFSDYLQGSNDFSDVMIRCHELVQQLHHLMERFRTCLVTRDDSLYLSKLSELFDEIDDRDSLARRLRQFRVYTPRQVVEEMALPVTYGLINEIADSFHCSPVLAGFSVFNMANVPDSVADLATYGKTKIDALAKHYGNTKADVFQGHRNESEPRFSEAAYKTEFEAFKHQLYILKQKEEAQGDNHKPSDAGGLLDDPVYANAFPAMNHLVTLSQLVPSSTASVERLFSLMNSLCTPSRNRLSQTMLDSLIRICMQNEDLSDRQLQQILHNFKTMKRREIKL